MSKEKIILARQYGVQGWESTLSEALTELATITGYNIRVTHERGDIGEKEITSTIFAEKII